MRICRWIGTVMLLCGCSHNEPVAQKTPPPADPPLQPVLPSVISTEPEKTFPTLEEGIAYWEKQLIEENLNLRAKKSKEEIKKRFDSLPDNEKANVERIRTWLPNKRIKEMDNVDEDITTLSNNADQFDVTLSIRRLLEYADESGAQKLLQNLGVTSPRQMVRFRLAYGQLPPDMQALVWGVTQRVKKNGFQNLTTTDRLLLQRQGLFPTIFQ